MTVVFGCPACGREVAMLTNAMETQMVRSLGVEIGGGAAARAAPMEMVRTSLAQPRDGVFPAPGDAPEPAAERPAERPAGKCPFTGVVEGAFEEAAPQGPRWTAEAEQRLARIPSFVRAMVRANVQDFARERGYEVIDAAVMDEVKGRLGM